MLDLRAAAAGDSPSLVEIASVAVKVGTESPPKAPLADTETQARAETEVAAAAAAVAAAAAAAAVVVAAAAAVVAAVARSVESIV